MTASHPDRPVPTARLAGDPVEGDHCPPPHSRAWVPAAVVMLLGLALALLPHGIRWIRTGDPTWVSDTDELVPYGHLISHAYHQHWWQLGDPALPQGGHSMYPWVQFAPFMLVARILDSGPLSVLVLMRIWAGLTLGGGLFLLLRRPGWNPWLSAALAAWILTDQGWVNDGIPLRQQVRSVASVIHGSPIPEMHAWSGVLGHLRLITPGVSLIFLVLTVWTFGRLQENPNRRNLVAAGVALGLCIHAYFYFWTACVGALGLFLILDRARWRRYAAVLAIALVIGAPALIQSSLVKHSAGGEWLVRNSFFVPVPHPGWPISWRLVVLYAVSAWWVFRRAPHLRFLWTVGACALALTQQTQLTLLDIQNRHWQSLAGVILGLLCAHFVGTWWARARRPGWVAAAAVALLMIQVTGGFVLRGWATDQNEETRRTEDRRQMLLRLEHEAGPLPLENNAVIAGDTTITDWLVVTHGLRPLTGAVGLSPSVSDAEWARRRILNAILKGFEGTAAAESALGEYGVWFQLEHLSPEESAREKARLTEVYRELAGDPLAWCRRWQVRYLVLAAGRTPGGVGVGSKVHRIAAGSEWWVWELRPPAN